MDDTTRPADTGYRFIGKPIPRKEDERLITGKGRFTDDFNLDGQAHAVIVRSPYPHASVAIGLAIAAEAEASPRIAGRLTRNFGVWRDRDGGRGLAFDALFEKDTALAGAPLTRTRRYRAHHNVGHFRFVECSRLNDGAPAGDVTPWGEVRSPLCAELRDRPLDGVEVRRLPRPGDLVEERYLCDENGVIEVEIANLSAGYTKRYSPVAGPK